MELIDVLRQQGKPRTEYFVELPTVYGKLNLELAATPGTALSQAGTTAAMRQAADGDIEAALKLASKDPGSAEQGLLALTAKYP